MSGVRKLFQLGQLGQVGRLLRAHILKVFNRTNKLFYSNNSLYFRRQGGLTKQFQDFILRKNKSLTSRDLQDIFEDFKSKDDNDRNQLSIQTKEEAEKWVASMQDDWKAQQN